MHLSWQPLWSQDLFQKLSEKFCAAFCKFPIFDLILVDLYSNQVIHLGVNGERLKQSRGSGDGGKASGIAIAPLFHSHPFGQRPRGGESSFGKTNLIGIFHFHFHTSSTSTSSTSTPFLVRSKTLREGIIFWSADKSNRHLLSFHIHPSVVASESKTRLFENNMISIFPATTLPSLWI